MAVTSGGLGGLGGFVSNLYSDLLGRQGSPDEVSYWANSGQDPSSILNSFLGSQEYRQAAIPMMYQDFLGRAPDQAGLNNYLNSGQSLDSIANALMNSDEAKVYQASDQTHATPPPSANVPLPPRKPDWLAPFDFGGAKTPLDMTGKWYQHFAGQYGPGAAGGNFAVESGVNPLQPQTNTGLPDGTPYLDRNGNYTGYGLAQVGGYRLNGPDPKNGSMGLNDFAKMIGMDPNTQDPLQATELQLRHQLYEMQDGWLRNQHILDRMNNAKSLSDAVGIFGGPTGFERPRSPVIPGTQNFTDRLRDAEIIQQYFNGGLNSLTPDQRNQLMDWQNRTNPIPQVPQNLDTQQLGPSIDVSSLPAPAQTPNPMDQWTTNATNGLLQLAGMTNMPGTVTNNLTGVPAATTFPTIDPATYMQIGPYNSTAYSSGGAQQPMAANPFFDGGLGQGSNTPFLSPNLYPNTQPLPYMDFTTPTFDGGGFSGAGV